MKIRCAWVVAAVYLSAMGSQAQEIDPPASSRAALDTFLEAWNKGDNGKLRPTLNYPHLSLFGAGNLVVAEGPEDFSTDFEAMREREDWARSAWGAMVFEAESADKTHNVTTYHRYDSKGERYRSGHVYYIVTRKDGHWGMQFRGPVPVGTPDAEAVKAARGVIEQFFVDWNNADNAALQKLYNFPHAFMLGNGRVALAKGPDDLETDFEGMRRREGWHSSTLESLTITHAGPNVAFAKVVFARRHEDGEVYRTVPVLWIVTRQEGHWGIQLRSLMPALED